MALEHRDANGDTALHHACEAGHLECVRALLSREGPSAEAGTDGAVIVQAMLEGRKEKVILTSVCFPVGCCWVPPQCFPVSWLFL